ncbi:MAG: DUF1700 domain-containing protein [Ruminococcus sp.]|nr:DUF1700 domain-containing protein [Ruminococcus sp.]
MCKQEFLEQLSRGLYGLPQEDIEERVSFYSEMIDDQVEEGISEAEAVCALGSVEEIVAQVVAEVPLTRIAKERVKTKRKLSSGEIILLTLGSPIWLSLLIAALAVVFSLYISLWAVIVSLWSVFVSFFVCTICCVLACFVLFFSGNGIAGAFSLCAGLVLAGLTIFMFYGCFAATKGTAILTKKIIIWIKNCFIRKEEV